MAEAAQTTDIMVEVKRRQAMLDKLKQDESALAAKVAAHRSNLGTGAAPQDKKLPRHVELKPLVDAALAAMTFDEYKAHRADGKLPEVAIEARDVVPQVPQNSLMLAAFTNNTFRLPAPAGVHPWSLDGNAQFWSQFSDTLQVYDDVRVVGLGWLGDYVVSFKDERVCDAKMLTFLAIPAQEHFAVKWLPGTHRLKWLDASTSEIGCVIERIADGHEMRSSGKPFLREEDARRFWLDHATNRPAENVQYLP